MKNMSLQRIQAMQSYKPPLSGRRSFSGLLLDFNERTTPPSKNVQKYIENLLKSNTLQFYPEYGDLQKKLGAYMGINPNQIMITNGSDQGIDLVFRAFTEKNDIVIIPTPSFAMFYQSAQIVGNKIKKPLYAKPYLRFPVDEVLSMIDSRVKLIVICNPNNPTGTQVLLRDIEKIAKNAPNAIILIDEAYAEFSQLSAVSLIKKYPNIIITRTLSKAFGLSSLRIGYLIGSKICINELSKIRGPYDINMVACYAAQAALEDIEDMQEYVTEVMTKAKPMVESFFTKNNISFYVSFANFILFAPKDYKKVWSLLKENGVLIRLQNNQNVKKSLRVSIGTVDQMKKFIDIYENKIIDKSKNKYAFLDRDGTLLFEPQDTFQIDALEKFNILGGVIEGLQVLIKQGYKLILISNQDGLGTKSFPKKNFLTIQNKLLSTLKEEGIIFEKIFICPHFPEENCFCRKPKTGLVEKLIKDEKIDKNNSFVCGDRDTDKLFAKNIGIKFLPMKTNGNFYSAIKEKERITT